MITRRWIALTVAFLLSAAPALAQTTNWWLNPGQDGRYWKLPQQTTAVIDTTSTAAKLLQNGVAPNTTPHGSVNTGANFAAPMYYSVTGDPAVTVNGPGGKTLSTHLPVGAVIESPVTGFDQTIGGTDQQKPGLVWSAFVCSMNTSGVLANGTTIITCTGGLQLDWGFGPIMEDAVTGQQGGGNAYGNINDYELNQIFNDPNYHIPHMLAVTLDRKMISNAGPVWPLALIDTANPNTGTLPQGQTYMIPASATMPSGLNRGTQALWHVLQEFGGIYYNAGSPGSFNVTAFAQSTNGQTIANQMVSGISSIMGSVGILTNQTGLSTVKGMVNGVRSDAFTPPPVLDLTPTGGVEVSSTTQGAYYPTTSAGFSVASGGYTATAPPVSNCPVSPNNTSLNAGSQSVLTDSLGQGWGIPVSGGPVFLQSTALPLASKAVSLAYVNGVMWYQNTTLQWFSFTSAGAIASGPQSGSPISQVETLAITAVPSQSAAVPFTVTGTIANATAVPTLQYSVNGGTFQALPTGKSQVPSPQTTAVTAGTWVVNQKLTLAGAPSAFGGMQYNYLLPANYDPVHFVYPLMMVGAGNDQGMNGSTYPVDGTTFVNRMESDNFRFNTVAFRTARPAIIVAPQCDQTLDLSGGSFNSNCGGYADSANGSWNEQAISAIQAHFMNDVGACGGTGTCSVDPTKRYGVGLSLSAIGYLAQMVDNNQVNNQGSASWTAGIGMSTQLFRPATPNSAVFSRMRNVPYMSICAPGDNPCNYDLPFWQSITGNTTYPTQAQYDAGGMAAIRAGTSSFYLIGSYNGGTAYGQFGCLNADGCDGTNIYAWLFQQQSGTPASGGSTVSQTAFSFTVPGLSAATSNTVSVRDANKTTVLATSNVFAVNGTGGSLSGSPKSPLPSGYLHASSNQIQDGSGNNVRLSCSGYGSPTGNYGSDMSIMRNQGFNCARYDLYGAQVCPGGICAFSTLDQVVSAATANNMKLVFDYKTSESGCGGVQPNGLWYDQNSSTPVSGVTWNALAQNGDGCAASGGTGNFSVSGGYLIDPTGSKFIPAGTGIYDFNMNAVIQDSTGFPLKFLFPKVNYLRVMVCAGGECPINGIVSGSQPTSITYPSPSKYLTIAALCQSARIVCEFEDHTSNGGQWEGTQGNTNVASLAPSGTLLTGSILPFWSAMAAQFKTNPYAWIGSLNELGSYGNPTAQGPYHQALYNAIRATGNNNMIDLCSGAGCGGSVGWVGPKALYSGTSPYATMTNVAFFLHTYGTYATVSAAQTALAGNTIAPQNGGPGCYGYTCIQQITTKDGVVPVIFNEWGDNSGGNPTTTNGQNIATAMQGLQALGIGQAGFVYFNPNTTLTGAGSYTQVNNGGSVGLTIGSGANQYSLVSPWGNYVAGLSNVNPFPGGTGGTNVASVTYSTFKSNWSQIAAHYQGNSTVIAMDLWNEPAVNSAYQTTLVNWGGNNGADASLMCSDVGTAVEAADPGVLVICEGPINQSGPFFSGIPYQSNFHNFMDLSLAASKPVTLTGDQSNHVVYSVHDFPSFGLNPPWLDSGSGKITMMNTAWGSLVSGNTAPVWLGAIGASLDGSDGFLTDEQAWATTLTNYTNGLSGSSGGPTFTGCQQPVGADWFTFGNGTGSVNGTLNADGSNKAGQMTYWTGLLYTTCSQNNGGGGGGGGGGAGVGATTWNPGDLVGVTLSNGNTTATATGAHQGVRTSTSQSTGKVCIEANASTISPNWTFGISNSTFALTAAGGLGSDANGIGLDPNSGGGAQGIFYNNAALSTGSGASPNGEAETICVDLGAKLFWATNATMRAASHPWNNNGAASPATGTGGLSFAGVTCPCFGIFNTDETPSVATLNTAGPFAVSTPSGFSAWQLPVLSGNHPIVLNLGN